MIFSLAFYGERCVELEITDHKVSITVHPGRRPKNPWLDWYSHEIKTRIFTHQQFSDAISSLNHKGAIND